MTELLQAKNYMIQLRRVIRPQSSSRFAIVWHLPSDVLPNNHPLAVITPCATGICVLDVRGLADAEIIRWMKGQFFGSRLEGLRESRKPFTYWLQLKTRRADVRILASEHRVSVTA